MVSRDDSKRARGGRLRESDKVFRLLIESVTDYAIFMLDSAGGVASWSAGAERIKGYRADEVLGRPFSLFYRPEAVAAGEPERALRIAQAVDRFQEEGWRVRKDGSEFLAEVTVTPLRDAAGRLRGFGTAIRDITERKRAEQALRDGEARLRGVVETAVDGIITIDESGIVETVNAAAQRMFGYAAEEMVGSNVSGLMPEPYRSEHDRYIANYRETGKRKIIGIGREVVGLRKDGATFPIYLAVSEVRLGDRRIFTGIVRDISAQKRTEERLRTSLIEKETLLREIHHRVKNNLQVICGLLGLQARSAGPELIAYFDDSQDRIRAMARVHEQLHLFDDAASFDLGRYLEALCADMVRIYGPEAPRLACRVAAAAPPVRVAFDAATPLVLIVNEILSNAFKHAFPEGRWGEVSVSLQRIDDRVVLRIRDNGVGLRKDRRRRGEGSMGLRLVEVLARQIGATASFRSSGGTAFTLSLPESALEESNQSAA